MTTAPITTIPALISALGNTDWYVRYNAALALRKIGNISAVPALTAALNDVDLYVRYFAERALEEIAARAEILNDGHKATIEVNPDGGYYLYWNTDDDAAALYESLAEAIEAAKGWDFGAGEIDEMEWEL
jgi:HEAT repeat protein